MKPILSIIASIGKNKELGFNNKLLWNIPEDLKYFKEKTLNKVVIVGKNTFLSIGEYTNYKFLPKRKIAVITLNDNNINIYKNENINIFNSIIDALKYYENEEEIFIIGGATIYQQTINLVDYIYLTEINIDYPNADVFFPDFNINDYTLTINKLNDNVSFKTYKKK